MLDHVAATSSRELFTLTVLVLALGIAVGSSLVFGVSMALGAFLAGLVVGRSDYSLRAASEALPMRDAFAVLFFVSVGMLLDPRYLLEAPVLIAGHARGGDARQAAHRVRVRVAASLPVQGCACRRDCAGADRRVLVHSRRRIGRDLGILTAEATQTLVAVSIISIVLNPLLYRAVGPIERWASARPRLWKLLNPRDPLISRRTRPTPRPAPARHRRRLRTHRADGQQTAARERHPTDRHRNEHGHGSGARRDGIDAVYGDSAHRETLEGARAANAAALILTSAGMSTTPEVIRLAREINPNVRVLARAAYLREVPDLQRAGADLVFTGEGEVALALTEAILRRLGATPDQIDRERARVHNELLGEQRAGEQTAQA